MNLIKTIAAAILIFGTAAEAAPKMEILQVQSLRTGEIVLNGKKINLSELQTSLGRAKTDGAVVWYYREAAGSEPTDKQMKIFKAVMDAKLPISLSTKPDFSDYVDEYGQSHSRKN